MRVSSPFTCEIVKGSYYLICFQLPESTIHTAQKKAQKKAQFIPQKKAQKKAQFIPQKKAQKKHNSYHKKKHKKNHKSCAFPARSHLKL